jgi:hypothetical protein
MTPQKREIIASTVLDAVLRHSPVKMSPHQALAKGRGHNAVRVRMFTAYFLRVRFGFTAQQAAEAIGFTNHGNACHAVRCALDRIPLYPSLHRQYVAICHELGCEPTIQLKGKARTIGEKTPQATPIVRSKPMAGGYVKPLRWSAEESARLREVRRRNYGIVYAMPR